VNAKIASALSLLTVAAIPLGAQQQPVISDRVPNALPTTYVPPACELKANHFKVGSAAGYLKAAIETDVPESKARILGQGEKVDLEAIQQNGQAKNPAAWYYLGRIYLQQGNLTGADTTLARAEQLAPDCKKDIQLFRRSAWIPLLTAGSKFYDEKNLDSAQVLLRQAALIYPASPITWNYLGSLANDRAHPDSAAIFFGRSVQAAEGSTDTTEIKIRNRSAFNQGALLLNTKQYGPAVTAFERYLTFVPNDVEGKRGLAAAYRGAGQPEKAQALEKDVVASGGGAGPAAPGGPASGDLMNAGVNLYNDKKYAEAATAFEKVVAAEPYNRDGLSNLSNTYLALKNGPKLLTTAQRLAAIEPLNETALKLVGEGYKQSGKIDDAVKAAERVLALPVDVKVNDFSVSGGSATLSATATGRQAQTPGGKPIAPTPTGIVVEFLDAGGKPVGTTEAQVPALAPGASQPIKATAQGAGIVAWRYKTK
jgi:tetratricopeptide (TPR) repeat protein